MALGLNVQLSAIDQTSKHTLRRPLILPCVLNEFSFEEAAAWENYDTVGGGAFSTPGGGDEKARQLRTTDLEVLTLDWSAPFLAGFSDQATVRRELFAILRHRKPFRLTAAVEPDPGYDELVMNAKLTNIRRRLGQTPDARYWDLSIEEWRNNEVERQGHSPSRGRNGVRLPAMHKLTENDTLDGLARSYYGNYQAWRRIADANGLRNWGARQELVKHRRYKKGDKIRIPTKPPVASINQPAV